MTASGAEPEATSWRPIASSRKVGETPSSRETCAAKPASTSSTIGIADRKSTRLNSSHRTNSYADFCLKKKRKSSGKLFFPGRDRGRGEKAGRSRRPARHPARVADRGAEEMPDRALPPDRRRAAAGLPG